MNDCAAGGKMPISGRKEFFQHQETELVDRVMNDSRDMLKRGDDGKSS